MTKGWILSGLLILGVTCGPSQEEQGDPITADQDRDDCDVGEVELAEAPLQVEVGAWAFLVGSRISGCDADLQAITDGEKALALEVVEGAVVGHHLHLIRLADDEDFRADLARKVNAVVGREVAETVEVEVLRASENM